MAIFARAPRKLGQQRSSSRIIRQRRWPSSFLGVEQLVAKSVQPLLIVRGHMPTIEVVTDEVPIVGYEVLSAYLAKTKPGIRLRTLLYDVTRFFNRIRPGEHYYLDDQHVSMGGYEFTFRALGITPRALFVASEVVPNIPVVGKNGQCPCGSGRKY